MKALTFLFSCVNFFLHSTYGDIRIVTDKQAKPKLQ